MHVRAQQTRTLGQAAACSTLTDPQAPSAGVRTADAVGANETGERKRAQAGRQRAPSTTTRAAPGHSWAESHRSPFAGGGGSSEWAARSWSTKATSLPARAQRHTALAAGVHSQGNGDAGREHGLQRCGLRRLEQRRRRQRSGSNGGGQAVRSRAMAAIHPVASNVLLIQSGRGPREGGLGSGRGSGRPSPPRRRRSAQPPMDQRRRRAGHASGTHLSVRGRS